MSAAPPDCDRGVAAASQTDAKASGSPWVLATCILASSLAFIDGSVVNVGLPAIGKSLHAAGGDLSWIVDGYLLPLSALLLTGGAAGDLYGRRLMLVAGTAVFAAASLLCAFAPSLTVLVAARLLQGAGAAMLMPNSLAILGASYSGEARGRAIGIWAAVGAGAGAVGPLLGGWLVDVVGWRAVFWINIPIALAAIALALRCLKDDRDPAHAPLDIPGAVLASAGLCALTWGLTSVSGRAGWTPGAGAALVAGAAAMAAFLAVERRRGDRAMLPLDLFASASFTGLTVLTLLLYGALGGLLVLVPYVLIEARGYSATAAGAALLPLPLVIAATSSTMGRIAGKIGSRLPLTIGPVVVAGGFLLALRIDATGSYWTAILPCLLAISIGMAGAVAPLTTAVLSSVDAKRTGVASGFNSAVARTGGLIATALLGAVLAMRGAALLNAFHIAALTGAAAALGAAVCAFLGVGRDAKRS